MTQKTLGTMTLAEINARAGETVITQEMGGTILIGTLIEARDSLGTGKPSSIVVDHGNGKHCIWPTQWHQAVFA